VPCPLQIVLLASAFLDVEEPSKEAQQRLIDWLWFTTYSQAFASQMSESRFGSFLEEVRKIVKGKVLEEPVVSDARRRPLPRFDFRNARSQSLALLLAQQKPRRPSGSRKTFPASKLLASQGNHVMSQIIASKGIGVSPSGARVLLPSEYLSDFRKMIERVGTTAEFDPQDLAVLESHVIDEEGADLYAIKEYAAFVSRREEKMNKMEEVRFNEIKSRLYPPIKQISHHPKRTRPWS
jgi:hypothetical protein